LHGAELLGVELREAPILVLWGIPSDAVSMVAPTAVIDGLNCKPKGYVRTFSRLRIKVGEGD
jgi:hypothetical protein